jgi:hypothetical protein
MRHTGYFVSGLIGTVVSLAFASTLVAQTPVEGAVKVVRKVGQAKYTTGNNVWQPLEVGTVLKPGATIQSSSVSGSYVDLGLGETAAVTEPAGASYRPYIPTSLTVSAAARPTAQQNVVRIWENTVLTIDKLTTQTTGADVVTDTRLELKTGRISGTVKKMSAGSRYEMKVPLGVTSIRGTSYDQDVDGVLKVFAGSALFSSASLPNGQAVPEGFQYDARSGQLTPIAQSMVQAFEQIFASMRIVQVGVPTTLASDKTINNVSPVVGQ